MIITRTIPSESVYIGILHMYTSPWAGFELTTLVVIGTDSICSCISNYHTIITRTVSSVYMGILHMCNTFIDGNVSILYGWSTSRVKPNTITLVFAASLAKHPALRSKRKNWSVQNENNMSAWNYIPTMYQQTVLSLN